MYHLEEFSNNYSKTSHDEGIIDVGTVTPLKYLIKFWRTLEMSLTDS